MVVTVYCGSSPGDNPRFAQEARHLAEWIAERGHSLVYGGSAVGLMGVVSDTVLAQGGQVTGVEPRFFIESGIAHHELTRLIEVETMSERKAQMIELGDAFVALPGGVGTLEEISEIMSRIRLGLTKAPCVLLNIDGFYDELRALLDKMERAGFMESHERAAIQFATSAREAAYLLETWTYDADAFARSTSVFG